MESVFTGWNVKREHFDSSADYWERRYHKDQGSGMGSYGALAWMKASFVNDFIKRHGIRSVIDFGAGDGNQLRWLAEVDYIGLDVAPTTVRRLQERFKGDRRKQFHLCGGPGTPLEAGWTGQLGLSLDVIYHLVEDAVYERYMRDLFSASQEYVVIYSSNHEASDPALPHVRDRHFTPYVAGNFPDWRLILTRHNPLGFVSRSDFFVYARRDTAS